MSDKPLVTSEQWEAMQERARSVGRANPAHYAKYVRQLCPAVRPHGPWLHDDESTVWGELLGTHLIPCCGSSALFAEAVKAADYARKVTP
jgi:hypothetical protein